VFEYYANNQWDFNNDNFVEMRQLINSKEKKIFKIDGEGLDIDRYIVDCIHAARLYILNEPPETIPAARRHMRV
jgi:fatty acyl-CoA reductase